MGPEFEPVLGEKGYKVTKNPIWWNTKTSPTILIITESAKQREIHALETPKRLNNKPNHISSVVGGRTFSVLVNVTLMVIKTKVKEESSYLENRNLSRT